MARFRAKNKNTKDYFCYAYASLCFVPYAYWAVTHAKQNSIDTLYFISRDGHHLKRIADTVIKCLNIDIKTKYIYGSRKAWRIPSFINEFDDSFFLPFGNVASATNYKNLLKALSIDDETFLKIFPNLSYIKKMKTLSKDTRTNLISIFSTSEEYKNYLLNFAKEKRKIIDDYFRQEMNFDEKFAFVEYWGRGYTQTCHTRLLQNVAGKKFDVPYYYLRSIYPSSGSDIRYNYTSSNASLIFVEALFANIDYKSIEGYEKSENGKVVPVFKPADCDMALLEALNLRLIEFCKDIMQVDFKNADCILRELLHYSLTYFSEHQDDELLIENIAPLVDAVGTFGEKREFAPVLSKEDIDQIIEKQVNLIDKTSSMIMSLARSSKEVNEYYEYLTEVKPLEIKENKKGKKERRGRLTKNFENKHALFNYKNARKKNQADYDKYASNPVQNIACFVAKNPNKQQEFKSLVKYYKNNGFEISFVELKNNIDIESIKKIAVAKYIFLCENSRFFSLIKLRGESKLVQLFKNPFPLYKFGYQVNRFGIKSSEKRNKILFGAQYSVITAAGNGVAKVYRDTMRTKHNVEAVKAFGCPVTDCYFDKSYKEKAIEKLKKAQIDTSKKFILYLSNDKTKKSGFDYLQILQLKTALEKEYNLLILGDNADSIIASYAKRFDKFAYCINGVLSARAAMCIADIIVGDYTNIIFESVLTQKPVFLTSDYSAKEHLDTLFDINDITFAPIVSDTEQLIEKIIDIENYDYTKYNEFKAKYLGNCDGNSTKRLADFLK